MAGEQDGWTHLSILSARQHRLQICVISFRFRATDEAYFFRFARRGDTDALDNLRRLLFAVVIIGDLVFVTIDAEANLGQIKLSAKVMRVVKLLLSSGSIFRKLEFDLSRQTKTILQISSFAG